MQPPSPDFKRLNDAERLLTAENGVAEEDRHRREDDDAARARFDEALTTKRRPSLVERVLRWAGRRT